MPVRWGILSTANINRKFIAAAGSPGVEVVAIASRHAPRAQAAAAELGIPRALGSYEALLEDPEIEALYISLPNSLHVEWTIKALEAGKHVLCEKPLSRRAAEVERAFATAEREGRLLMEAFMYRHHPQTRRLCELVAAGAVGRLRAIRAAFSFNTPDPENVRLRAALDGGALMDVGCYCVDAARLLAGEPERVTAQQVRGGDGVDVVFTGTLSFSGGVLAHFDCGLKLAPRDQLEVVGEEGVLRLGDPWHCRHPGIELCRDGRRELIAIPAGDSYRLEAENFSAAIRGQDEPLLSRADALGQARTIEALYSAAEAAGAVAVG